MTDRSRRAVSTLVETDPEFQALCKSLYGGVDASLVYQDVFDGGVDLSKAAYTPKHAPAGPKVEEMAAGAYRSATQLLPEKFRGANGLGRLLHKPLENKKLTAGVVAGGALIHGAGKRKGQQEGYEQALYGKSVATPEQKNSDRERKLARVGQVGNGVAIVGGVHALHQAGANLVRVKRGLDPVAHAPKKPGKYAIPLALGGVGLHVAELGGDAISHHFLHQASKKKGSLQPVKKADEIPDLELAGTFSKFDDDKRQAFGYASVVKKDGLPVIDRQGDYIDADEMEKAAYHYVQKSRKGGDMHRRTVGPDGLDAPHHVSDLIESMVFTPEKCQAMGLPDEVAKKLEGHWWVGYQIHDDATWTEVRKKGRTGFSIHGRGKRQETTVDSVMGF